MSDVYSIRVTLMGRKKFVAVTYAEVSKNGIMWENQFVGWVM